MILNLVNPKGEIIRVTTGRWREFLKLARRHGWDPLGTKPSETHLRGRYKNPEGGYDMGEVRKAMESWSGTYYSKEGQTVTYADSLNIAFALEEVKGEDQEGLAEFIRFCKSGPFSIT